MPKCVTGWPTPVLPCRSVCLEFVNKCQGILALASHAGMFRALCDLLPQQDYSPTTCFIPEGFTPSTTAVLGKHLLPGEQGSLPNQKDGDARRKFWKERKGQFFTNDGVGVRIVAEVSRAHQVKFENRSRSSEN